MRLYGSAAVTALALMLASGCATKRFVRERISPVEQRTQQLERKHQETLSQIAQLEERTSRGISRVEERAMSAENRAIQAGRTAEEAREGAERAGQLAQLAQEWGEQNQGRLAELAARLENSDKFHLVAHETVLFRFNQSGLSPEACQKLQTLLARLAGLPRYVFEIAGYADPTGPQDYNLALSRRRADAVVRYLVRHEVPLRRIYMTGLGESTPEELAAGGRARSFAADRRLARRVEVKVFAPVADSASAKAPTETAANRP